MMRKMLFVTVILTVLLSMNSILSLQIRDEFTSCENNVCSYNSNAPYTTNYLKFKFINGEINISYRDFYLTLAPFVVYNGNTYTYQDTKTFLQNNNMNLNVIVKDNGYNYKYGLNLTNIPDNIKDKIDFIGLKLISSKGLGYDDIQVNDNYVLLKNKIRLDYSDLINSNFSINLQDKQTILIGNVSGKNELWLDPTVSYQILSSSDDANDMPSGTNLCSLTASYLDIGRYTGYDFESYIGLRFTNLAIPQGSKIIKANITFTAYVPSSADTSSLSPIIAGEDVDDGLTFDCVNREPSDLWGSITTSQVTWAITDSGWSQNSKNTTIDISNVIEEITNRTGWSSGNDLNILIKGVSSTTRRRVYSYDGDSGKVATLNITYTEVTKTPTRIDLFLNGTQGDVYYQNQSYANFTAKLNVSGNVNMTTNMTNWINQLNKPSPYTNISQVICSNNNTYYNITSWFEENATHTSSSESHYAICYFTITTTTTTSTTTSTTTTTTTTTIPTTTTTTLPTYECNYYLPYTYLDDAMVRQDYPDTNYGIVDYSYIGSNPNGTQRFRYYIKFNISGIDNTINIINSFLYVNVRDVSSVGYPEIQSFWITNNTWLETELTWNNQLCGNDYGTVSGINCNSTVLDKSIGIANGYHYFNVTNALSWEFSESDNENVSFILMGTNQTEYNTTNTNRWYVYAKEQFSEGITPYLIVNGTCGEPPTTTTTTIPITTTTIIGTTTTIIVATTTTIILPFGNYTSYSCSGQILIRNVTNVINETYSNSIYEYTNCEFGCSSYLGKARCEPEDFIIWILFAIIFIGITIMIKTFMRYRA